MKDTSPELSLHFREMLMKKSGQERLQMGFSMYDIREIRKWIFLRFYGHDFTLEMRKRILEYLDRSD